MNVVLDFLQLSNLITHLSRDMINMVLEQEFVVNYQSQIFVGVNCIQDLTIYANI